MTNSKNTKKALLASVLSIMLCVVMLIGTTFAWFTDSVTSSGNIIKSGTLDVTMKWANGTDNPTDTKTVWNDASEGAIFNYDLWEPGYTEVRHVKVSNEGTLALKYELNLAATGTVSELAKVIDVYYINGGQQIADRTALPADSKVGTLEQVLANPELATGHILGKKDTVVNSDIATIALKMQETAGNDYQNKSIGSEFAIKLLATQYTAEEDSFGKDYDENAHASAVFGKDIVSNLNNPAVPEVVAGENIDMSLNEFKESNGNCTVVVPDGKTLDLNKNSVIRPEGSGNGLSFLPGATGTVKNGTIFAQSDTCAVDIAEGATVYFEDMNFEGHGNEILKVRAKAGTKTTVIFRNCTFNNAPVNLMGRDGATELDIQFVNCKFTGTYKMYDAQGNPLTDNYGHIHYTESLIKATSNYLYGDIKLEGCTFDFDASEAKYSEEIIELYGCYQGNYPGKMLNVLVKDVTMTGKNITPIDVDSRYVTGITIKEEGTNSYTVDGVKVKYDGTK